MRGSPACVYVFRGLWAKEGERVDWVFYFPRGNSDRPHHSWCDLVLWLAYSGATQTLAPEACSFTGCLVYLLAPRDVFFIMSAMSPFLLPPPVLSGHYCVAWDLCKAFIPVPTRDQAGVLAMPVDFLSAETAKWRGTHLPPHAAALE